MKTRKASYTKDQPIEQVKKIVLKGDVDVVLRCGRPPSLSISGDSKNAVESVKTTMSADKLVIEREATTSVMIGSVGGGHGGVYMTQTSTGSNNVQIGFISGDAGISLGVGGAEVIINGRSVAGGGDRALVSIAMPEAPDFALKGSGRVAMNGVEQNRLRLSIEGAGEIHAYGHVELLEVEIAGSGCFGAPNLSAEQATLTITGSGDIDATVRRDVRARIVGSGIIAVRGNPSQRSDSVTGSGRIRFL